MTVINVQNDFSQGEVDRKVFSRFDLELYKKSAARLRNVFVEPTGGVTRRFGLKYIDEISANSNEYLLHYFDFDINKRYLLVFTDKLLTIYLDGIIDATLQTPYLGNEVSDLSIAQSFNLMIIAHPNHSPQQLSLVGSFTLAKIIFKNAPGHDFKKNYNNVKFTFSQTGIGQDSTLTADTPIFSEDYVGGYIIAVGPTTSDKNGFGKITEFLNSENVTINITSEFNSEYKNIGKLKGVDCLLTEKAWSDYRGYPQSCTFYEGRLVFGGSRSLPETLFMSVVNDYTDFDIGVGNDADAIQVTVQTDSINNIKYVIGDKSLQLFTDSNVFSSPQLNEQPLTPSNISVRKQSNKGVGLTQPQILDGSTLFVAAGGKKVDSFRYQESTGSYVSTSVSLLASDLIRNPIDSDVRKSSPDDQSDYYMLVNGDDGSLAVLQAVEDQNVIAWTLSTTKGFFKRITRVGSEIYFIVEREIEGNIKIYLEYADFSLFTDSSITQEYVDPTTAISNLDHLIGEEVNVIADSFVLLNRIVDENGSITIERPSNIVTVGLPFIIPGEEKKQVLIELLPLNVNTEQGPTAYIRKRVNRVFIDYFESNAIFINDILIPDHVFGPNALNQPSTPTTGLFEEPVMLGWEPRKSYIISQESPSPFTILGIGYEITL